MDALAEPAPGVRVREGPAGDGNGERARRVPRSAAGSSSSTRRTSRSTSAPSAAPRSCVLKAKAELIEHGRRPVRSERLQLDRPVVIRLVTYVRVPRDVHRRKITRKAVLARDDWTCQYCGSRANRADGRPRDPAQPRRHVGLGEHRRLLRPVQPPQGQPPPPRDRDAPAQRPQAPGPERLHPGRGPKGPPSWEPYLQWRRRLAAALVRALRSGRERGAVGASRNDEGPPLGGPSLGAVLSEEAMYSIGRDVSRSRFPAGARVWIRRAAHTCRLAARHLQRPEKHVTQFRTTSFLWSEHSSKPARLAACAGNASRARLEVGFDFEPTSSRHASDLDSGVGFVSMPGSSLGAGLRRPGPPRRLPILRQRVRDRIVLALGQAGVGLVRARRPGRRR